MIRVFIPSGDKGLTRAIESAAANGGFAVEFSAAETANCVFVEVEQSENIADLRDNRCVIAVGNVDFESVLTALRFGAFDYLRLPFDEDEVSACLERIAVSVGYPSPQPHRRFFFDNKTLLEFLDQRKVSFDELNRLYATKFEVGLYQLLLIKLDSPSSYKLSEQKIFNAASSVAEQTAGYFKPVCFDLIVEIRGDGVLALLNYDRAKMKKLMEMTNGGLRTALRKYAFSASITVCVSEIVTTPYHLWKLKEQLRDIEWSRMFVGTDRTIIYNDELFQCNANTKEFLADKLTNFRVAFEIIDTRRLIELAEDIFSLPEDVLMTNDVRVTLRDALSLPFEIFSNELENFSVPSALHLEMRYALRRCTTVAKYKEEYIRRIRELAGVIVKFSQKKSSTAVTGAIAFIKRNLRRTLKLEETAKYVHLNKSYFSHLFKTETGLAFTEYVKKAKLDYALELLRDTDMNISEVADRIGLPSVQAFGKMFKKEKKITPSQYRSLYRNSE